MRIEDKLAQLNRTVNYVPVALRKVLMSQSQLIEELNRDQLRQGKRSDGTSLPDYSQNSVNYFGKPEGAIKLFDTGDFYESLDISYFDDRMVFDDTDEKTHMLVEKYGQMIFGLSEENKLKVIDIIKPLLAKELKAFYKSI